MLKELKEKLEHVRWEEAVEPSWWVRLARRQVGLYFYVARELVRDRCLQQAAALTFTTLLALVPLFAVGFAIYRSFAGIEGLEERVQDTIFQLVLAGPPVPEANDDALDAVPLEELAAGRTASELLREGRRRALQGEDVRAFHLYLAALERGEDTAAARQALASARLPALGTYLGAVRGLTEEARERYFAAAGLPTAEELRRSAPGERAREMYGQALDHLDRGEHEEAARALRRAEAHGYPPLRTRELRGRLHREAAARLAEAGHLSAAAAEYRESLLHYHDAMFLAAVTGPRDVLRGLGQRHRIARRESGELLLRLARQEVELYRTLGERADVDATPALQAGLDDLEAAALMMEQPGEAHSLLARLLWEEAGRPEQAREHYEAAIRGESAAAARDISMAVSDYIREFLSEVGRARIGILASIFLIVAATELLSTIEKTLNHIWKVARRRPFWIRFTSFWTLICLAPLLIGVTIWLEETMSRYLSVTFHGMAVLGPLARVVTTAGRYLLPFLMMWLLLVALYKFLPHTRVRLKSAAWGACVGAVLLMLVRPLFSLYMTNAITYEKMKIYGSLGAVPIFLLWVWLLWIIVLFGAELSFTIQNLGLLRYHDRLRRLSDVFVDRYLAARIVLYVAREFWQTGQPISAGRLAEILHITPEEAGDAANRLVELGLLTPVGDQRDEFHPARDLSRLKLSEVLSITDSFRSESRSRQPQNKPYEDKLEAAFRAAIEAQQAALEDVTFRDLLLQCEEDTAG